MRHLIDSYIGAEESRVLSNFDDLSLVELLVQKGQDAIKSLPKNIQNNRVAVAETIENNLRRVIIEESPTNPMYYEKMSVLLDELIRMRKKEVEDYEGYLKKIVELSKKIKQPSTSVQYPSSLNSDAKRNLYDNLAKNEVLVYDLDHKIMTTKKDRWRDTKIKQREVELVVKEVLENYGIKKASEVQRIFDLVKNQKDY